MNKKNIHLPKVYAGFPSPAEDFIDLPISLDKTLIQNPSSTFMAYVEGDSMINKGIYNGDIVIIDRSLNAQYGDIIIATLDGEFIIKEYSNCNNKPILIPHNPKYKTIYINENMDFAIWGIVIHSIRSYR